MEVCFNTASLALIRADWNRQLQIVGFVPTMGALHDGHASLVKRALLECDRVVVSIFVNPTQFNAKEDFDNYPITLEQDLQMLEEIGIDAVFVPNVEEMYGRNQHVSSVDYGSLTRSFEGAIRKGHFDGVVAIVRKLLTAVDPDRAYFGQKDLQQLGVLKRLGRDEFPAIDIIGCPLVRDVSGLALSSRNVRLDEEHRMKALHLNEAIHEVGLSGLRGDELTSLIQGIKAKLNEIQGMDVEYLDVVDANSFEVWRSEISGAQPHVIIAASVGGVRLIDNCLVTCS